MAKNASARFNKESVSRQSNTSSLTLYIFLGIAVSAAMAHFSQVLWQGQRPKIPARGFDVL